MKYSLTEKMVIFEDFCNSPDEALFPLEKVKAILSCCEPLLDFNRCLITGIEYFKVGNHYLYRKSAILNWINKNKAKKKLQKKHNEKI